MPPARERTVRFAFLSFKAPTPLESHSLLNNSRITLSPCLLFRVSDTAFCNSCAIRHPRSTPTATTLDWAQGFRTLAISGPPLRFRDERWCRQSWSGVHFRLLFRYSVVSDLKVMKTACRVSSSFPRCAVSVLFLEHNPYISRIGKTGCIGGSRQPDFGKLPSFRSCG